MRTVKINIFAKISKARKVTTRDLHRRCTILTQNHTSPPRRFANKAMKKHLAKKLGKTGHRWDTMFSCLEWTWAPRRKQQNSQNGSPGTSRMTLSRLLGPRCPQNPPPKGPTTPQTIIFDDFGARFGIIGGFSGTLFDFLGLLASSGNLLNHQVPETETWDLIEA